MATILVVEDDADTSEALSKTLERQGHDVRCASNGWEGLLILDASHIDLVVLDLMMPGMDGATFLGILRNDQRRSQLPVLVVTALENSPLAARAQQLGVQRFFRKAAYSAPELVEAVREHVGPPKNNHSTQEPHQKNARSPGAPHLNN
jgi:CheY-like chemotaxis protein